MQKIIEIYRYCELCVMRVFKQILVLLQIKHFAQIHPQLGDRIRILQCNSDIRCLKCLKCLILKNYTKI